MRLPIVPEISSRDGSTAKNGRMYNVLSEKKPTGQAISAVRPGLTESVIISGAGRGVVCWNGTLISVYGATAYAGTTGADFVDTPTPEIYLGHIGYGNGLFLATLTGSTVGTSPDGVTWTSRSMPSSAGWGPLAWNGAVYCIVSTENGTKAATSPDGVTWTARTLPSSDYWNGIAWNGTVFCAVGGNSNKAATSPDGITWTGRTMPSSIGWGRIAWNGTVFCAISGTSTNQAATSPDGITWTARTLPSTAFWSNIAWNGTVFCIVDGASFSTKAATSPDGVTWTARTLPSSNYGWTGIASGDGIFLAIKRGVGAYSSDGITWTDVTLPQSNGYFFVAASDTIYVAPNSMSAFAAISDIPARPIGTISGTFFDFAQSPT